MGENRKNRCLNTATAKLIVDRIRDLPDLKIPERSLPVDRLPSLAKSLEVDPAYLMRLALDHAVGATAAAACLC